MANNIYFELAFNSLKFICFLKVNFQTITSHGYISLAIELGRRLGLFHALAKCAAADGSESSGASADDIARNSGSFNFNSSG